MTATEEKNREITEALYKQNRELAVLNKVLSLLRKLYQISLLTLDPDELIRQLSQSIKTALELESIAIIQSMADAPPTNTPTSKTFALVARDHSIGYMIIKLNRDYETLSEHEKNSITSTVDVVAIAIDRANLHKELTVANTKLQEADRMKSQFLSFASHQVKSPMTVVKDYADLIRDGSYGVIPDKVKETATKIHDSADRLIDLVNDLLDLRKLEEGKIEYNFTQVDVGALLKNTFEELKTLADAKHLEMTLEAPAEPMMVKADESKLRQVFQNLLDNSIKYTESGWVKVQIINQQSKVLIKISDSGLGIPQDLLSSLFEQFNRGSKEAKKIQGTGLGLYIAKQFVLAHGGTVTAASDGPGKGSTFTVNLPIQS